MGGRDESRITVSQLTADTQSEGLSLFSFLFVSVTFVWSFS